MKTKSESAWLAERVRFVQNGGAWSVSRRQALLIATDAVLGREVNWETNGAKRLRRQSEWHDRHECTFSNCHHTLDWQGEDWVALLNSLKHRDLA